MPEKAGWDDSPDEQIQLEGQTEVCAPRLYRVVLLNDDYTTMDFVVEILVQVFHKSPAEATKIMLDVHKKGSGVCGVYSYDIAQTKVAQVYRQAKQHSFPLQCSLEPE
jgi:ATP-dependent Clp protease adaptor protein ClpS